MEREGKLILALSLSLSLCVLPVLSFAEKEVPPGISKQDEIPGKGLHKGWQQGKHKGWTKEELLKLKQENPEKFKEVIQGKREHIKQRLEYLKQNEPEKYERIRREIRERQAQRLEKLKQGNPEKFKELMQQRRAKLQEHIEKLKTQDPQKYERIMQHREKLQELRRYPRRENLRDRREDGRDRANYQQANPDAGSGSAIRARPADGDERKR